MVKLISDIPKVVIARDYLFSVLESKLDEIKNLEGHKFFTYTDETCEEVANKIKDFVLKDKIVSPVISVFGFKPFFRWSKVVGYTTKGTSKIYVNLRKIPVMTEQEIAGNLLHEICHLAGYEHGNNYFTDKKKYSVPYFLGYFIANEVTVIDLISNEYQIEID